MGNPLRIDEVLKKTGLGKTAIYKMCADEPPVFPRPQKATTSKGKTVTNLWDEDEVEEWIVWRKFQSRKNRATPEELAKWDGYKPSWLSCPPPPRKPVQRPDLKIVTATTPEAA